MKPIYLSELSLKHSHQWPLAVKIISAILIHALILCSGYWFVISADIERLNILQLQETNLRSSFESKHTQMSDLQTYQSQLHILQERFGTMLKQLPTKNEMPGLLEEILKIGTSAGLNFELFAPQSELTYDDYIELPIKNRVTGSYRQLALFFSGLTQMKSIATIHDLSIEVLAGDQLAMTMMAKIHRYRVQ